MEEVGGWFREGDVPNLCARETFKLRTMDEKELIREKKMGVLSRRNSICDGVKAEKDMELYRC